VSIDKLTYVSCDVCGGNPTEPTIYGAREARKYARQAEGYVRRDGMDVCPDCQRESNPAASRREQNS
jgi:hypothetical protein